MNIYEALQTILTQEENSEAREVIKKIADAYAALAPDWSQAREWANFFAIDSDGTAVWYEEAPRRGHEHWFTKSGRWLTSAEVRVPVGIDWRALLWERR